MRLIRLGLPAVILSAGLLLPALVAAHAELVSSSPEDGESVAEPPTEVVIIFDSELDPDGSEFTVTDASGAVVGTGEVDLEVAERNEMLGAVEITEPGTYTVEWTSVAEDGDEATGELTFAYASAAEASGEQPNTAVTPARSDGRAVATGIALLLTAASLSIRGLRRRLDGVHGA